MSFATDQHFNDISFGYENEQAYQEYLLPMQEAERAQLDRLARLMEQSYEADADDQSNKLSVIQENAEQVVLADEPQPDSELIRETKALGA